jgi:hypothetical protein
MNKTYLVHHGIKGQRWGVRRFQNEDGSLTPAGRKRYDINDDGTVSLKDKYRKGQNIRGIAKAGIGTALVTKGVTTIVKGKKNKVNFSSADGKKMLNRAVLSTLIGAVVVSSSVTNFVNANKNRTFNSTGMGGTPEAFRGNPKTRKQVIAYQNRSKNKK